MALLHRQTPRPLLIITPTEKEAKQCCRDLSFFAGAGKVFLYSPWEVVSTDLFAWQREVELSRSEVLCRLLAEEPVMAVVPVKALLQKVPPKKTVAAYIRPVAMGDFIDRDEWILHLLQGGYHRVSLVEGKGEFAVRGHVVDLFPPTAVAPLPSGVYRG